VKVLIVDKRGRYLNISKRIRAKDPNREFIEEILCEDDVRKEGHFLETKDYAVIFLHASDQQQEVREFFENKCKEKIVVAFSGGPPITFKGWDASRHCKVSLIGNGMESYFRIEDFIENYIENAEIDVKILGAEEEKREKLKSFTVMKYRIAHLFLPIDIDLLGLDEVDGYSVPGPQFSKEEQKRDALKAYLEAIFDSRKGGYYRQQLADLWWIIDNIEVPSTQKKETEIEAAAATKYEYYPVQPSNIVKQDDQESIVDLVNKLEPGLTTDQLKDRLLRLAGLSPDASEQRPELHSAIFQFMCFLDWCNQNSNDVNAETVKQILSFQPLKDWLPKVQCARSAISPPFFHFWFCALMGCLNDLEELIQ
jgi:hypothetical protein